MPQQNNLQDLLDRISLAWPVMGKEWQQITLQGFLDRQFQGISNALTRVLGPTGRDVMIGSSQAELRQAILADLVDVVPVVGDVSNLLRVQDAVRQAGEFPRKRAPMLVLDLLGGVVPVLGDIWDIATPSNSLAWLESRGISPTDIRAIFSQLRREFQRV